MTYYRLDSTKLSFREFWQWKPGLPFLFLALSKLLGIRNKSGLGSARPETLLRIDPGALPRRHRAALGPLLAQSTSLGFEVEFLYSVPFLGPFTGAAAALTSGDRLSLALFGHSEPLSALRPVPPTYAFLSCKADGNILATSGGLPSLIRPAPEVEVVKLRHGSLGQTWKRHAARLSTESPRLLPYRNGEVADAVLRMIQRNFDYNVSRGVYVPLTEAEVEALGQRP